MKKIYINESQISKDLLLPKFLFDAVRAHETSLGDNPAFPGEDTYPFDYTILKERYRDVYSKMHELGLPTNANTDELKSMLSKMVTACKEMEKPIKDSLEKICENTVNRIFAIPEGAVNINCKLVDKVSYKISVSVTPEVSTGKSFRFKDINDFELSKAAVAKRRFINALIMGASNWLTSGFHGYYNLEINKINPELIPLYEKILALNDYLLFITEEEMTDEKPKQGSYVEVYVGGNGKKSTIQSQGVIFPLLLHDTIKGLFELFSVHGLPEDKEKREYIIKKSDFLLAEPWDMRLGVPLWTKIFGTKIEEDNLLPYMFMYLVKLPYEEFNATMKELLIGSEKGVEIFGQLMKAAQRNDGYQKFQKRINARNVDRSVIADSYFTASELDGYDIDSNEGDGNVIEEDSAEEAMWKGKMYKFWQSSNRSIPFLLFHDGTFIYGTRDYDETHEEVIMMYCYQLLDEEPPMREFDGRLDYSDAVDEIQVNHERLYNRLVNNIKIQGRIFETDDGSYVFTCYDPLDEDGAKEMMAYAAFKLDLPREKCYYVGHYNTVIISLT